MSEQFCAFLSYLSYDPNDALFIFSVMMFSVFVVPIISDKTKIPSIVFYILFGVILENLIFTNSDSVSGKIEVFSEVGKLYLMFIAGVEIDIFFFKKNVNKSAIFGVLSFIIPLVVGTAVIVHFFGYTMLAAILTASLFASHTLLSLPLINKFGIGNSEPISVAVGASIVSDIAVLALLAVIADIATGAGIRPPHYWVILFGSWVLFICAVLYVVPKVARRVFRLFSEDGYAQFLFVFAAVCLISWLASTLQLKPLIGAFFCGLALCKIIPKQGILMTKINFIGFTLFIPFFFISAGMLMNPSDPAAFGYAALIGIVLTVLAMATKTAAGVVFGKIFKYSKDAVMMLSGMTLQQAATTIVIAVIGREAGIINPQLFNAAMILILLSCSLGEVISVHFARRYAQNMPKQPAGASQLESKTLVFIPNITVCAGLLDFACLFRHYAKKYVISPLALAGGSRESTAEAETILGFCMNHAHELEEVYHPEMRIANNAVDGIMRTAVETHAGMVICPFENHSQTLINECPTRLVFTRITTNIPATNRIIAVFMPTSEDRSDLLLFIAEIKHLAQQVSAGVVFYLTENQSAKIGAKINKFLKGALRYEIVLKNHWNTIKRELPGLISGNDTVIISMGTRQRLFRLPSADKYPFHLAARFEQNCIFAAYPPLSLVSREDDYNLLDENSTLGGVPEYANLEAVETPECDFRNITDEIARKIEAPPDELYDLLYSSLELYPVELIPGTVLVHAHTDAVAVPRVFVWQQTEARIVTPSKIAPGVLIIVLNPLHGDPQVHLKTLSRIAGIFMNPKVSEAIGDCRSSAELIGKLQALDDADRTVFTDKP